MASVKSYREMAGQVARSAAVHGGIGAAVGGGFGLLTSPDDRWGGARKGALVGGGVGLGTGLVTGALPFVLTHSSRKNAIDTEAAYNAAASHFNNIRAQANNTVSPELDQMFEEALNQKLHAKQLWDDAQREYFGSTNYPRLLVPDHAYAALYTTVPAAAISGATAGSRHNEKKVRGEIAQLKANQPVASTQESADTPIKQAYLNATGDNTFDQEKMAGWLTDTISKAKDYITPSAVGKVVSPASGALKATGTMKQLQAGRNFGGATVDPFVKMRKSMMSPVGAAA